MRFRSVNPFNGEVIREYDGHSDNEVQKKIRQAEARFRLWKNTSFDERSRLMHRAAQELLKNKEHYSRIITVEMGKPIMESYVEVEKCAKMCDYYAEKAEEFLSDEPLNPPHGEAYVHYNPLGVVLAVMPWNFPFWQVFRFAAPAVMAGNASLLKHASNVPGCAIAIEEVFKKAGFPEGVFTTLLISSDQVRKVIDNEDVVAVTLTGSELAGKSVAAAAGENLKKSVLELGGSDPFIVLKDADVTTAATIGAKARMINTGQSCIAAKRFILEKDIARQFTDIFISEVEKMPFGNPENQSTVYATLARKDLAEEIYEQVKKSIDMGAKVIYGNLPEKITDASFPPMILGDLKPGMPAHDEEIFGPVASFFIVENEAEAVEVANNSRFGLGGSLWTTDKNKARELAAGIESGAIYVNQMMFSDPTVPFGGIKNSGYGRELSHLGIREFVNQKTIWIK